MTTRHLEPTCVYHGLVWGSLPPEYPTEQAERVYRYLLDQMDAQSSPHALMGHGFKAVAYRFRAATEYLCDFESSFRAPGGVAPPVDEHYRQERALFGFFTSGLACVESFAFALYAIASHYNPSSFKLTKERLRSITPEAVAKALHGPWPKALITTAINEIVEDATFQTWKLIRNVLSHRVVPSRAITVTPGSETQSTWLLNSHQCLDQDEPLETVTELRRLWLEKRIRELWNGVEQSFPPS